MLKCPNQIVNEVACKGFRFDPWSSHPPANCGPGYRGFLCAECDATANAAYHRSGPHRCTLCDSGEQASMGWAVATLLLLLAIALLFRARRACCCCRAKRSPDTYGSVSRETQELTESPLNSEVSGSDAPAATHTSCCSRFEQFVELLVQRLAWHSVRIVRGWAMSTAAKRRTMLLYNI